MIRQNKDAKIYQFPVRSPETAPHYAQPGEAQPPHRDSKVVESAHLIQPPVSLTQAEIIAERDRRVTYQATASGEQL